MSVVKSKRSQSKVDFEMILFQVTDGVDFLIDNKKSAQLYIKERSHILFRYEWNGIWIDWIQLV